MRYLVRKHFQSCLQIVLALCSLVMAHFVSEHCKAFSEILTSKWYCALCIFINLQGKHNLHKKQYKKCSFMTHFSKWLKQWAIMKALSDDTNLSNLANPSRLADRRCWEGNIRVRWTNMYSFYIVSSKHGIFPLTTMQIKSKIIC